MSAQPRRRVLLKLSGEAFGAGSLGVNPDVVQAWSPDVEGYEIRADRAIDFSDVSVG